MSHEHEARRSEAEAEASVVAAAGRRSLVASRYPALAQALGDRGGSGGGGEPTIHDAATAAVEHKDGGAAVDPGVAARVGAHLGADFSGVRVHSDPLAQQATAAMGARAFAYGSDVFLGAGESGGDVGLMAHENRTTPALTYYGGQLTVRVDPHLPAANPGLNLFVSGEIKKGGTAVPGGTFPVQPFRAGTDSMRLGELLLQQAPGQRVAAAVTSRTVPLLPMFIRSDSAARVTAAGGDPATQVAYALGSLAPADILIERPGWAGWQAWRGPAIYINRTPDPLNPGAPRSIDEMAMFAAHEAIHSVDDPPPGWRTSTPDPFYRYRMEFRAYWVDGRYSGLSTDRDDSVSFGPKSPRANAIFQHIYTGYDYTRQAS